MADPLPVHHGAQARAQAVVRKEARAGANLALGGVVLNAVLVVVKFAGGIFGHSYALIADGTDSLVDILTSLLVWAGLRVAARPPDEEHPYGHGRAESLAALGVAGFIFVAAGIVAWQAIHLIIIPHQGPEWWTLVLLAGVVAVKIWFSRRVAARSDTARSTALGAEAWHHGSDAMTSSAAFVGISIALIGGRGWESADDWAALFASVVVTFNGVGVVRRALDEMMDTVPADLEQKVREIAAQVAGVHELDKCRVRKSGLSYLVDIQVRVDGNLTVRAGHLIAHDVRDTLLRSPLRVTDVSVHVEPDTRD